MYRNALWFQTIPDVQHVSSVAVVSSGNLSSHSRRHYSGFSMTGLYTRMRRPFVVSPNEPAKYVYPWLTIHIYHDGELRIYFFREVRMRRGLSTSCTTYVVSAIHVRTIIPLTVPAYNHLLIHTSQNMICSSLHALFYPPRAQTLREKSGSSSPRSCAMRGSSYQLIWTTGSRLPQRNAPYVSNSPN